MAVQTVLIRFRAVYGEGLSLDVAGEERLYLAHYFPGLKAFVTALDTPDPNDPKSRTLRDKIRDRHPEVKDLNFTDEGGIPIFFGELEITYDEDDPAPPPYVIGKLVSEHVPPGWELSGEAEAALGALLDNILWIPPQPLPRIIGIFYPQYISYTINDIEYEIYRDEGKHRSPGSKGGLR
jgi:hypothetical protein